MDDDAVKDPNELEDDALEVEEGPEEDELEDEVEEFGDLEEEVM